MKMGTTT